MLWKVEQNRHLARMAGLEAGLEAMEIGIERKCKTDTWLGGGKPQGRPRGRPQASRLWKLQQRRDLARMRQALEAMEIAAKERHAWLG